MNIDQRVRVVIGDLVIQAQAQQQKIEEQAEQIAKLEGELSQANAQVEMYKARKGIPCVGGFEAKYQDEAMLHAMKQDHAHGEWPQIVPATGNGG